MMTGNLQTITAQAGNFQSGAILERGAETLRHMGGFGFYPLLAFFGFLLFVLFIFITVRLIQLACHSDGNHGFGYPRQLQKKYINKKRAYENKLEQTLKNQNPWQQERPDAALEILRKRFAAGEIKKEEYEEKEQILKG